MTRNIIISIFFLTVAAIVLFIIKPFMVQEASADDNQELKEEWLQLFNGNDIKDWEIKITGYEHNENYGNTFRVEDGLLKVLYDNYDAFDERYGHIFYKIKFSSYLLAVEYRFTDEQAKNGPGWAYRNSGVMLHSQKPSTMLKNQDFPISIEVQFLGGDGTNERSTSNLCTPGTNVVMNNELFTPHCTNSSSKTYHGDQWVRAEVLVLGDSVIHHILEGDTVLSYKNPQIGGGNVSDFDPKFKQEGQLLNEGYIALQSESHPIEFRKVELFNLEKYRTDPEQLQGVLKKLSKQK